MRIVLSPEFKASLHSKIRLLLKNKVGFGELPLRLRGLATHSWVATTHIGWLPAASSLWALMPSSGFHGYLHTCIHRQKLKKKKEKVPGKSCPGEKTWL